jgi:hypothetical protein
MRNLALLVTCVVAQVIVGPAPSRVEGSASLSAILSGGGEFVVTLTVEDRAPASAAGDVTAVALQIDGESLQEVLIFPGSGVTTYDAVMGPLSPGRHTLAVRPSRFWAADTRVTVRGVSARPVGDGSDHAAYRFAPRIGLRTDTVGAMSDLPMYMYCERIPQPDLKAGATATVAPGFSRGQLRYTVIFTNEDGGTASRALMARWGRAVDIEFVYEALVRDGKLVSGTYQGPDHKVLPYRGPTNPPLLNVVTLNNMFLDRGRALAAVRPRPEVVDLTSATRESVLDRQPWMYRVMAGELKREGKLGSVVDDPRRYLYAEARLALTDAAVAARASLTNGTWRASHHGEIEMTINRDGWVRTAIPLGDALPGDVRTIAWECLPLPGKGAQGRCDIDATRAFVLTDNYAPGRNLIAATTLRLRVGEMGEPGKGERDEGKGERAGPNRLDR